MDRVKQLRSDLYSVGSIFVRVHLLVDDEGITLVDTGFFHDFHRVKRAITALGRKPSDLKAIVLTHGHFDHTMNAAALGEWSGAKLYAPAGDELHVAGRYPYRGIARLCGALEEMGRAVTRYRAPRVDVWFRDGDELPFWGGLKAVSLPGHTQGHSGLYSRTKGVLFVGDAFALSWRVALPPPIFNTDSRRMEESFYKVAGFDVDLLVPAHYLWFDPHNIVRVRACARRLRQKGGRGSAALPSSRP